MANEGVKKSRFARISAVGGMVAGFAGDVVGAASSAKATGRALEEEFHQRVAQRLLRSFGEMRGLPMKFGQMLSYVDDMVPAEYRSIYRQTLAQLRVNVNPMTWATMSRVLEAELGAPPDSFFQQIDHEPIAAASIGQVYRARHRGRDVAVKVQYPGVAEAIESDIKNADSIMSALSAIAPKTDVKTSMADISARLREECDYRVEGRNQTDFLTAWAGDPEVHIPEVLHSSPRVLVTELCPGLDWESMLAQSGPSERSRYGRTLLRFVFVSLHAHGMFNADPHPGNYAFLEAGRVNFFDFGCVQRFSRDDVRDFEEVQDAVVAGESGDRLRERIRRVYAVEADLDEELWSIVEEYVRLGLEPMSAPQPYRYGPEYTQRLSDHMMRAKQAAARKIRQTGFWDAQRRGVVFLHRLNYGVASLLARLGAEVDWRLIVEESRRRPG